MALFSETRGFVFGFSVGFGTGLVARELLPTIGQIARPAAKGLMRTGIAVMEKLKEGIAKAGESIEDLAAEVNLELRTKKIAAMNQKRTKKTSKLKKTKESSSGPTSHATPPSAHERKTA